MQNILRFAALSLFVFCYLNEKSFSQGLNNLSVKGEKSISINFHMKETSIGRNEVELKDFTVLPYRTKEFVSLKQVGANGVLVLLKNASGEIISQQNISSPFTQHLEVPSLDGHIESTDIKSQEANFNVRLPYNITAQRVEVYQLNERKTLSLLATFVLK
ncbi:MAG: hypothetical protein D4R43_01375 [Sphingobacteriales bacterium]|nr:MAG: hypothetical protein D4R43_01375 [Sphingobacteriales bacterium]